jgi:hypothetical protein
MTVFLHDKSRFVHTAFLPANLVNTFGNCYEYLRKRLVMCTPNRLTFDRPETQFLPLSFRFHEIALCKRTALSPLDFYWCAREEVMHRSKWVRLCKSESRSGNRITFSTALGTSYTHESHWQRKHYAPLYVTLRRVDAPLALPEGGVETFVVQVGRVVMI